MPSELNIDNKNYKDILFRNVTVVFLDLLNKRVTTSLVIDGKEESFNVPFFYHFAGDENFMKDFFIEVPHGCSIPTHAEGNFERNPKGIIKLSGITVKQNEITNKFVRGSLKKTDYDDNGQKILKAFSAYLFSLPINMTFEVKLFGDSMNQILQMTASIMEEFYKNNMMYYQFRGTRIPAQFQFPDAFSSIDKTIPFTYEDNNKVSSTMEVSVETFYPIYDEKTMFYKGNKILEFRGTVNDEAYRLDSTYKNKNTDVGSVGYSMGSDPDTSVT